jgi:hypothetical protein
MEFHSFETVQFGPLRVQNSNSEAFIDHSTIFDPKISQYWRVPSCFNRVLPASRNGIQAPVQKVVDWESWESIGENGREPSGPSTSAQCIVGILGAFSTRL